MHSEIEGLLAALHQERKRSRVILTICAIYTLISLVGSAFAFSRSSPSLSEIAPLMTAQVLAMVVLAYMVRTRFRRPTPPTSSVRDNTLDALAVTRREISTLKLLGLSMAAILVLVAVAVFSLSSSGKMDARSVSSFTEVILLVAIFNACLLWLKWTRKLRPRRERLTRIMRDLDSR